MKHYEKHIMLALVILSVLFMLGSFGFKFLKNRVSISVDESKQTEQVNELATEIPEVLPEGALVVEDLSMVVKKLVSSKYTKDINDITVEELQSDGIFVRGNYTIAGSDTPMSYLAYFYNNKWEVIYEGLYEETPCAALSKVDFPLGIMPDCFNSETQTLETRI
jgi:hypothetical protein